MATAAIDRGATAKGAVRGVERFAWGVVGYNVLVVLWGALVRATESGAGCGNNWPLCNGVAIPVSPTLHTIIEFTHRQMVTGDVIGVIALLVWTFRASITGAAARVFTVASTVLLVNEAILGALLVKLGYVTGNKSIGRVVVLSIHLSNTLILLAALTLTALMLGTGQMWAKLGRPRVRARRFALVGLLATLVVGVSGSLAALGDTLFPAASLSAAMAQDFAAASPWLLRVRWVHPASAVAAALFVVWLVRRAGWVRSRWVIGLLGFQFAVGLADIVLLAPTWMQILHLLGADLYWIALVILTARVVWVAGRETAGAEGELPQIHPQLQTID
jgi:cytochrome c oxidase assembly protein subunit 15